jgi:hypothetical protein
MQSSEIVFNTNLEGIIFPVSNPTGSYTDKPVSEFPVACTVLLLSLLRHVIIALLYLVEYVIFLCPFCVILALLLLP